MMVTSVPPKAGRLATGSYVANSPIKGDPFGFTPDHVKQGHVQGGLAMPGDRKTTIYTSPLVTYHDTATQAEIKPRASIGNAKMVSPFGHVPEIQPHERNILGMGRVIIPESKTQFGESTSDTAFHPQAKLVHTRVMPQSARDTSKNFDLTSFVSRNNNWSDPNNSFVRGTTTPANPGSHGAGRWSFAKKGAAG